jgi:hypothetical protein
MNDNTPITGESQFWAEVFKRYPYSTVELTQVEQPLLHYFCVVRPRNSEALSGRGPSRLVALRNAISNGAERPKRTRRTRAQIAEDTRRAAGVAEPVQPPYEQGEDQNP